MWQVVNSCYPKYIIFWVTRVENSLFVHVYMFGLRIMITIFCVHATHAITMCYLFLPTLPPTPTPTPPQPPPCPHPAPHMTPNPPPSQTQLLSIRSSSEKTNIASLSASPFTACRESNLARAARTKRTSCGRATRRLSAGRPLNRQHGQCPPLITFKVADTIG